MYMESENREAEELDLLCREACNTPELTQEEELELSPDDEPPPFTAPNVTSAGISFAARLPADVLHHQPVQRDQESQRQELAPNINWLAELAIIATSPQSPLMPKTTHHSHRKSPQQHAVLMTDRPDRCMHNYARPPPPSSSPPLTHPSRHRQSGLVSGGNGLSASSHFSSSQRLADPPALSKSWPTTAWHCFMKGTRVRLSEDRRREWRLAEDVPSDDSLQEDRKLKEVLSMLLGKDTTSLCGLKLVQFEETTAVDRTKENMVHMVFRTEVADREISAECALDHPFFVRDKGWCSFHPGLTYTRYGLPCQEIEYGDVCVPPPHSGTSPDQEEDTDSVFDEFSAVNFLSTLAKQRRELQTSPVRSPPSSPTKRQRNSSGNSDQPVKAKRPMNAFMLFAKKFRMEYTQLYPGKDNRAISVILGDRWKKMKVEERKVYAQEAKVLAERHKKIHPDCWKRKRSTSASST
ncbi:HBP1 [Branchiostoma lanceolatum]|uniref:HMG box-containing protein 1 n=1 Tax=Branchiostoma lanceolatum TaxID=7740 RepID=A0A8J9ZXM0_BRALA|nr:HBP1 [Branchiostoma lanceolatum]